MKRSVLWIILSAILFLVPLSAMAQVSVSVGISLPPPIVFQAPPAVIVLPDTPDVYAVPDVNGDMFFYNGWWWRLWDGYWYRSRYYDRGWAYFNHVPRFYYDVDPGWRGYYRSHNWHGHPWNYQRIDNGRLQRSWKGWHDNGYWQKQKAWGVQGYQPRPAQQQQALRQQRQQQYQQRPEVQQHQQQVRAPQPQRPQAPPQRQFQQQPQQAPQPQQGQPQVERQHGQPQGQERQGGAERGRPEGKPEGGRKEDRRIGPLEREARAGLCPPEGVIDHSTGSVMMKVVPLPTSLFTSMLPLWASMIP